jgi:spore coat polysaccharide biosynthesis predicted glycosyltransferase SpsG
MSLEAAMMGVPMVLLPVADNQRPGAQSMARAGAAVTVSSAEAAAEAARLLLGDPGETARMSRQGRELVDGRGPERILAALEGSVWRETPAGLA